MPYGDGTHPKHDLGKLAQAFEDADDPLAQLEGIARNGLHLPADADNEAVDLDPDPEGAARVEHQRDVVRQVGGFFAAVKATLAGDNKPEGLISSW